MKLQINSAQFKPIGVDDAKYIDSRVPSEVCQLMGELRKLGM